LGHKLVVLEDVIGSIKENVAPAEAKVKELRPRG
jgi:hypothetical protein